MCRHRSSRLAPILGIQDSVQIRYRIAAVPHAQQSPDHGPDHIAQETVRGKHEPPAIRVQPLQVRPFQRAEISPDLSVKLGKRSKVPVPAKAFPRLAHQVRIEREPAMIAAVFQERIFPGMQVIMVRPPGSREPGMQALIHFKDGMHSNGFVKQGVELVDPRFPHRIRNFLLAVEMSEKGRCVHTCIRPAAAGNRHVMLQKHGQSLFQA